VRQKIDILVRRWNKSSIAFCLDCLYVGPTYVVVTYSLILKILNRSSEFSDFKRVCVGARTSWSNALLAALVLPLVSQFKYLGCREDLAAMAFCGCRCAR